MGNSKGKTVAEGFKDTCHPGLTPAVYDTDQQMLVVSIHARDGIELWRKDVAPLINSRHLLLPYKYSS